MIAADAREILHKRRVCFGCLHSLLQLTVCVYQVLGFDDAIAEGDSGPQVSIGFTMINPARYGMSF